MVAATLATETTENVGKISSVPGQGAQEPASPVLVGSMVHHLTYMPDNIGSHIWELAGEDQ